MYFTDIFEDVETFHNAIKIPEGIVEGVVERYKVEGEYLVPVNLLAVAYTGFGKNIATVVDYINSEYFQKFTEEGAFDVALDGFLFVDIHSQEIVTVRKGDTLEDVQKRLETTAIIVEHFNENDIDEAAELPIITFSKEEELDLFSLVDSIMKTDEINVNIRVFTHDSDEIGNKKSFDLDSPPLAPTLGFSR